MKRALLLVVALTPAAGAEAPVDRPEAFQVERDAPPPGQAELSFDGGAPVAPWAASVQLGYLDRPFELHTSQRQNYPVERRETIAFGGALSLGSSIVVDMRIPLSHQVGDRMQGLGDDRPLDRWVPGDLGLGVRLHVADREPVDVFVRGAATLGTGDDHDYAGEARYTLAWALIGRFTLPHRIVIAGTAGVRFRGAEVVVADRLLGDELTGGLGATVQLPAIRGLYCDANELRATAEVVGVLGNDVGGERGPSPLELRLGLVSRIRPYLAVAARVGRGLDDQIGAPRFRGMLEIVYSRL